MNVRFLNKNQKKYANMVFETLAKNANDIYIVFSPMDFQVLYVSPNVDELLGLAVEAVTYDIHVLWRTSEEESSYPTAEEIRMIKGAKTYSRDFSRIHMKTKETKYFKESVYATELLGKDYLIAVLSDRTKEHRELQNLQHELYVKKSQSRLRKDFMYNMSRDMLTPMNTMKGLITLLEREGTQSLQIKQRAKQLDNTYQHLRNTINHVMDMSNVVRDTEKIHMLEFDAHDMLQDVIAKSVDRANEKQHEFTCQAVPLHSLYLGAEESVKIILEKLLANAFEYTPDGGSIQLRVDMEPNTEREGYAKLKFSVSDNGNGMNEDVVQELLEPISREDTNNVAKDLGSGLGLAVTKYLLEVMGGDIHIQSEVGKGTEVTAEIDFLIMDDTLKEPMVYQQGKEIQEATTEKETDVKENLSLQGIRILMAEDNELNAEILQELLMLEGAYCDIASNGKEAVDMFLATQSDNAYDIIIMDIQMPIMDGIEATRQIRGSEHEAAETIPIIAVTANVLEEDVEKTINAGMNAHLSKPVDLKRIKEIIHIFLDY